MGAKEVRKLLKRRKKKCETAGQRCEMGAKNGCENGLNRPFCAQNVTAVTGTCVRSCDTDIALQVWRQVAVTICFSQENP